MHHANGMMWLQQLGQYAGMQQLGGSDSNSNGTVHAYGVAIICRNSIKIMWQLSAKAPCCTHDCHLAPPLPLTCRAGPWLLRMWLRVAIWMRYAMAA